MYIDTSNSTTSAVWNYGSTQCQAHDTTQLSVAAEGKRNENHVSWRHRQTDTWLSSPRTTGSQHLFQDTTEDSKSMSVGPVFSRQSNDQISEQCDKGKKNETASSFRLFGVEVIDHSTNSSTMEKVASQPISVTGTTAGQVSNLLVTESEQKSDISKASKDTTTEQLQSSSKESQSKQSYSTLGRSRTKVLILLNNTECHLNVNSSY